MTEGWVERESPGWRAVDTVLAVATASIFAWGVLFGGWSVFIVMSLFWFENVMIGVLNLAKMLTTGARTGVGGVTGSLFFGAFFTVHYGLFTAAHGVLLVAIFGGQQAGGATNDGLVDPLFGMIDRVLADRDGWVAVLTITLVQVAAFVRWSRATRTQPTPLNELMTAPYGRIVILHVTLLAGGFIATALKAPVLGALVLIGLKLAYDLVSLTRTAGSSDKVAEATARERVRSLLIVGRRKIDGRP